MPSGVKDGRRETNVPNARTETLIHDHTLDGALLLLYQTLELLERWVVEDRIEAEKRDWRMRYDWIIDQS